MKQNIIKTIHIESLTSKGYGSSNTLEVPKTLPSEEIEVEIFKKNHGKLLQVLKPSPDRVEPRCSHFPICGGCKLQQMDYEAQLKWKEGEVRKAFSSFENLTFLPIVPSSSIFEWRNKMEFSFSEDLSKNKYLGLVMQDGKGKVLNVERCHLAASWMSDLLKEVRKWWEEEGLLAYKPNQNSGTLRSLIVREGVTTGDRMIMLHVSGNPEYPMTKKQIDSFKKMALKFTPSVSDAVISIFLLIQQSIKGQKTEFFEMHLGGKDLIRERFLGHLFLISPRSFFQPNTLQAANLYKMGIDLLKLTNQEVVYDLYCGTGTLGMIASSYAKEVIGIDISKEACLDASQNLSINKIYNARIFNGDVPAVLKGNFPQADSVMVDPPRVGLSKEAIQEILKLNPKKILYISCNFQSLAMNVLDFIQAGYHLDILQPVDQFPHTYHVESIALITKEH